MGTDSDTENPDLATHVNDDIDLRLKDGYINARWILMGVVYATLFFDGAFIYGWVAVANMLRQQGAYSSGCPPKQDGDASVSSSCDYQENRLSFLFFIGVCAEQLPSGFIYGPFVDKAGPKISSVVACSMFVLGAVMLAFSNDHTFNAYVPAIVIMVAGVPGIILSSCMHVTNLWPLQSSLMILTTSVVFIIGIGFTFVLNSIIIALGNGRTAFRAVMCTYAGLSSIFIPLFLWLQPSTSFHLGEAYVLTRRLRPLRVRMSDLDRAQGKAKYHEVPSLEPTKPSQPDSEAENWKAASNPVFDPLGGEDPGAPEQAPGGGSNEAGSATEEGSSGSALPEGAPSREEAGGAGGAGSSVGVQLPGGVEGEGAGLDEAPVEAGKSAQGAQEVFVDVSITESRRHTELRSMSFWDQLRTFEFIGMVVYFAFNFQFPNFWLATLKTQLALKGDDGHYADLSNILIFVAVPFTFPFTVWLMHHGGHGFTLAVGQSLCMAFQAFQLVPSLKVQIVTMIIYGVRDFMLWGTVLAIVGRIFGYVNFGKIFGLLSFLTGAFGLLNIPINNWVVDSLDNRYWIITVAQMVLLTPLFLYCFVLWRREHRNVEENVITSTRRVLAAPQPESA